MAYAYDEQFMDYTTRSSRYSARRIVEQLHALLPIGSVLDLGCAEGTWLAAWREVGVAQLCGVDGDYVRRDRLRIAVDDFHVADLARPIELARRFDLVQSLEVAEHLPAAAADTFVENLVRHARGLILFSAAPPGQGGEFHVNEQPYEYWRAKFRRHGYAPYDYIRPRIASDPAISFWYRYNVLLYVHEERAAELPAALRASRVADGTAIADCSPVWFRLRKALVRKVPPRLQLWLARAKARWLRQGWWAPRRQADEAATQVADQPAKRLP
jgi:SAM-dependent methyltransferase